MKSELRRVTKRWSRNWRTSARSSFFPSRAPFHSQFHRFQTQDCWKGTDRATLGTSPSTSCSSFCSSFSSFELNYRINFMNQKKQNQNWKVVPVMASTSAISWSSSMYLILSSSMASTMLLRRLTVSRSSCKSESSRILSDEVFSHSVIN